MPRKDALKATVCSSVLCPIHSNHAAQVFAHNTAFIITITGRFFYVVMSVFWHKLIEEFGTQDKQHIYRVPAPLFSITNKCVGKNGLQSHCHTALGNNFRSNLALLFPCDRFINRGYTLLNLTHKGRYTVIDTFPSLCDSCKKFILLDVCLCTVMLESF